jgi:fructose-bisphosphate aldolase class 1
MSREFLDNLIEDRIKIIKKDKDPNHIYELLQKHLKHSIDELKKDYRVTLNIIQRRIFISGTSEKISNLFEYLDGKDVKFESTETDKLRVDLEHFLYRIY